MSRLRYTHVWQVYCMILVIFPLSVCGVFTGPTDQLVAVSDTITLQCRAGSGVAITFSSWSLDGDNFATKDGVFNTAERYSNFEVVNTDTANGQMDLRILNVEYEDRGSYRCQINSDSKTATLTVEVPATNVTISVDGTAQSPDATVTLTEDIPVALVCTALGAKPKVSIDWYKNTVPMSGDTETVPTGGEATDTESTISPFTATRIDDRSRIECRTAGHQVADPQSEFITLNVSFAPVVTDLTYSDGSITCEANANPTSNIKYYIILNGTKPSNPTGPTLAFNRDENYCTEVSCEVSNAIGTGTKAMPEPLCPGKPLDVGIIAAIVVGGILLIAVVIALVVCFVKHLLCFALCLASNKTKNGGPPPKKPPSITNADMIRNQSDVRQSVHKYEDEPKKPRIPRSSTGNAAGKQQQQPSPEKDALRQKAPPATKDDQGYPMDTYDGDNEPSAGQAGLNYTQVQFPNRQGETNGHRPINPPEEEPTQYASILV